MSGGGARIDWSYSGTDINVGPGATRAEKLLPLAAAAALCAWTIATALHHELQWSVWQWALALLLAFDIGGGTVANSLNSCKRFYHSPAPPDERGLARLARNHILFAGLHLHPLLVHAAFDGGNILLGLGWYAALLLAALLALSVPLYLARPAATFCVGAAIAANSALPVPAGFEWLMPLLFLKIVLGHCTREEPYRPLSPQPPAH